MFELADFCKPVTASFLTLRQRQMAVERLQENQTGVENKHVKMYQAVEALLDPKTYIFAIFACVASVPNGGISNFGTLIIKGFGFSTLNTTLLQIPYGLIVAIAVLICVFANDYMSAKLGKNTRVWFILVFLLPNFAGTFGLRYLNPNNHVGRLLCYYLTGPYNAGFLLMLSLSTANTAGHTKKVVTNGITFLGYCAGEIGTVNPQTSADIFPRQHLRPVLLQDVTGTHV